MPNDSASYWQGYAGYPVLAVMMKEGRLPYDRELAEKLSASTGIPSTQA